MQDQSTEESVPVSSSDFTLKRCLWPAESPTNLTGETLLLSRVTIGSQVYNFISKMTTAQPSNNELNGRTCKYCPKFCYSEAEAVQHELLRHRKNKKFFCSICNAGFTRQTYLMDHELIHVGVKFHCPKCPSFFSLRSNLTRHLRQHDGGKPFTCEICKTSFKLKKTLQDHIRTHTGEKPFSCSICHRKYSRTSSLRRHYTKHMENEESYECSYCHKKFVWKSDLARHVKIHLKDDPNPLVKIPLPEGIQLTNGSFGIESNMETEECERIILQDEE